MPFNNEENKRKKKKEVLEYMYDFVPRIIGLCTINVPGRLNRVCSLYDGMKCCLDMMNDFVGRNIFLIKIGLRGEGPILRSCRKVTTNGGMGRKLS